MIQKHVQKLHSALYLIFRVLVGLLFAQHGAQKLFGYFGGTAQPLMSLMGVVGVIELIGGIAIALGLFTRLFAILCAIVMIGAYIKVHASQGLIPIVNKGELALLYLAAFLMLTAHGNGKFSLEQAIFKKEMF